MAQKLITQAEYARRLGVSRQYINRLVKSGKIPVFAGGKVDAAAADAARVDNADPARAPFSKLAQQEIPRFLREDLPQAPAADPKQSSYQDARTLREQANAQRAQLELKQLQGLLVEKKAVEKEIGSIYRDFREKLLRIPRREAGKLVTLKTEREVAAYLEEMIRQALHSYADELETDTECLPTTDNLSPASSPVPFDRPSAYV